MKLLHTADWHLGQTRFGNQTASGNSRIADQAGALERMTRAAVTEKVDAVIFAGDTFDTRWVAPEVLAMFSAALTRLRAADIGAIIVPGNHDGMTAIAQPGTHALNYLRALDVPGVEVLTVPGPVRLYLPNGQPINVVAMPYPHKRAFDLSLPEHDPQDRVKEAGRRLTEAILVETEAFRDLPGPLVLVAHLTVAGARTGSEASLMKMGWDVSIDERALEPFDYGALGHIHRHQQVAGSGWYSGSVEAVDFGELGQEKVWVLADLEAGGVRAIPTGARRLERLIVIMEPDGDLWADWPGAADGPIVNLHITGDRQPRAADVARIQRQLRDRGASYVHTTRDITTTSTRLSESEVARDTDILTVTHRYLMAAGVADNEVEATMLMARELVAAAAE